jgi:sugar phosphate isomerase/epimerase
MSQIKIGIQLDCLGLPLREAIPAAARIGAHGVQLQTDKELAPESLSQTGRRHLLHSLQNQRLELVALGAMTRRGFDVLDKLESRIQFIKRTIKLSADLRAPFVVVPFGSIPSQPESPQGLAYFDGVKQVAEEGDRLGVRVALETGPNSLSEVAKFLVELNRYPLAVNYNPANLIARGLSPFAGLSEVAGRLVGLHVKDLIRTSTTVSGFMETPLGEGELDLDRLHRELASADYRGFWTLERDSAGGGDREFERSIAVLSRL